VCQQSRLRDVPESRKVVAAFLPTAGQQPLIFSNMAIPFRPARKGSLFLKQHNHGSIAMHFCLTGQYTPRALNNILENPTTNRYEAAKKLIEWAGGKLISMYSVAAEGPGVLTIFDVPEPSSAPAIAGIVVAAGTLQNVKLTRLFTQEEITPIRQKASKLRASYTPPGG
jgi:uncharacterized protein with GYD domain